MIHRVIEPFVCLTLIAIGLVGCDEIVKERLDPARSTVSRHLLDRCGVDNDGSYVSMSGGDVVLTSRQSHSEVLASYNSNHYSPLISPNNDKVVTFHYEEGKGYVHLSTFRSGVERDFPLGQAIAVPVAFSCDGGLLLLHKYSSDGIGQGVVMRSIVLNLTSGISDEIGDKAVVDSSGTHLLTFENGILWKSFLGSKGTKRRITTGLVPIALSNDGMKAIVSASDQVLQLLDLGSGEYRPIANGHSALFMASGRSIAVVSGDENKISIVRIDEKSEEVLSKWQNYNSIPIQSSNGRFFVFEKFEGGTSRKVFVYDEESNSLAILK